MEVFLGSRITVVQIGKVFFFYLGSAQVKKAAQEQMRRRNRSIEGNCKPSYV